MRNAPADATQQTDQDADSPTDGDPVEDDPWWEDPIEDTEEEMQDEWRDMSGDALTTVAAMAQGVHAQCPLATVRNLRRDPAYSVERLAERCYAKEYTLDIRQPDWPVLLSPMVQDHECVKRVGLNSLRPEEMSDFKVGVLIVNNHVIAFHNDDDGAFRVYDNDSQESQQGTFKSMRADEIMETWSMSDNFPTIIGVLSEGSDLSLRLGPPITTLVHRRRRDREAAPDPPRQPPPAMRQTTLGFARGTGTA